MLVFKVDKPITALSFVATANGNNFSELSAEVVAIGGTAELVHDGLARVVVGGRSYNLPIGYVVVLGDDNRLLSKEQFELEYVQADSVDVKALVARITKLETALNKLTKAGGAGGGKTQKAAAAGDGDQK